jgi:outer membrane lipoprotein-sorting protein
MMRPIVVAALAAFLTTAGYAEGAAHPPKLTAEQIADKNVAARGGLEAWRNVQSMVWQGHMESADPGVPQLSFTLAQKRPNKERFEISQIGQKSLRVFNGTQGWKVKPSRDGSVDAQPFTPQDLEFARQAPGIDGPLVDYRAKGVAIELAGIEKVEGKNAYRLHVKMPSGEAHDVWIDAKTFLDVKYDRFTYRPSGERAIISVTFRNYRTVEGLQVPGTLEIGGGPSTPMARMVIEKVALNPPLDDKVFTPPNEGHKRRMATVDIDPPAADRRQAFGPGPTPAADPRVSSPAP